MNASTPPSLLSVEDNPETRLLLKYLLTDYDLTFASGADEALEALRSESIDLLLVDINLGDGKSGTELLALIRQREDWARIPIIAVTAYALPGDREDLLDAGFDEYVAKPFTRTELTETIDHALSDLCPC